LVMSQHCIATRIFTRWGSPSAHDFRPLQLLKRGISAKIGRTTATIRAAPRIRRAFVYRG
jgi:hypothetical protein